MPDSLFLSQFLGLLFIIIGASIFSSPQDWRQVILGVTRHPGRIHTIGMLQLFVGLLLVLSHNLWQGWPVLATIIAWGTLIKGLFFTLLPGKESIRLIGYFNNKKWFTFSGVFCLIWGVLMTGYGFGMF